MGVPLMMQMQGGGHQPHSMYPFAVDHMDPQQGHNMPKVDHGTSWDSHVLMDEKNLVRLLSQCIFLYGLRLQAL